jgi:hypothetical protein
MGREDLPLPEVSLCRPRRATQPDERDKTEEQEDQDPTQFWQTRCIRQAVVLSFPLEAGEMEMEVDNRSCDRTESEEVLAHLFRSTEVRQG